MIYFSFLCIGFIIGFSFSSFFENISYKIEKYKKKQQNNDENFIGHLKAARVLNIGPLRDTFKVNFLGEKSSILENDNKTYYLFDNYLQNDDYIYLYRMVYSLNCKEKMSCEDLKKNVFDLESLDVNKEQLDNLVPEEFIHYSYIEDSIKTSSFPFHDYYFEEKLFRIPSKNYFIKKENEFREKTLKDFLNIFQYFLEEIDDIDLDILSSELIENINFILEKIKNNYINKDIFESYINLLKKIKIVYDTIFDNKNNNRSIESNLKDIENHLNILNNLLEE